MIQHAPSPQRHLPGELGLWIFILSDLLLFGLYFGLFAYDIAAEPAGFRAGQAALDTTLGLGNTFLLLTGSWAVVMATRVEKNAAKSAKYLSRAALSGVLFLLLKTVEYTHIIAAGYSITANSFFTWYFFLTGYHALHVFAGILFLYYVARRIKRGEILKEELTESAGCYWHLVDLLWIGIFTIAYLL